MNANFIMPIVAIVVTIIVCLVLRPEETTTLFWFNVIYGVIVECVFWGWLTLAKAKNNAFSAVYRIVSGVFSFYYIIFSLLLMVGYTCFFSMYIEMKWYVCSVILLNLLYYIISSIVGEHDNRMTDKQQELKDAQTLIVFNALRIEKLAFRCKQLYAAKGKVFETEANLQTPFDRLVRKVNTLPPNAFCNSDVLEQLNIICADCESKLSELEAATPDVFHVVESEFLHVIDGAISNVNFIKNNSRR